MQIEIFFIVIALAIFSERKTMIKQSGGADPAIVGLLLVVVVGGGFAVAYALSDNVKEFVNKLFDDDHNTSPPKSNPCATYTSSSECPTPRCKWDNSDNKCKEGGKLNNKPIKYIPNKDDTFHHWRVHGINMGTKIKDYYVVVANCPQSKTFSYNYNSHLGVIPGTTYDDYILAVVPKPIEFAKFKFTPVETIPGELQGWLLTNIKYNVSLENKSILYPSQKHVATKEWPHTNIVAGDPNSTYVKNALKTTHFHIIFRKVHAHSNKFTREKIEMGEALEVHHKTLDKNVKHRRGYIIGTMKMNVSKGEICHRCKKNPPTCLWSQTPRPTDLVAHFKGGKSETEWNHGQYFMKIEPIVA